VIPKDDDLLPRAYRLSVWIWGIGSLVLLPLQKWPAFLGWTIGSGLSLAVVRSLEMVVRRHFVAGNVNAKRSFDRAFAAKLPTILLSLIVVVLLGRKSMSFLAAFGGSLILVQSAIVLITAAQVIREYARDRK
jgi:hypothetical protein